jgi:hypothetical protein
MLSMRVLAFFSGLFAAGSAMAQSGPPAEELPVITVDGYSMIIPVSATTGAFSGHLSRSPARSADEPPDVHVDMT